MLFSNILLRYNLVDKISSGIDIITSKLFRLNKKVLLVDIDPQGNLSDAFLNISQVQYTIKDLLEGTITDINLADFNK